MNASLLIVIFVAVVGWASAQTTRNTSSDSEDKALELRNKAVQLAKEYPDSALQFAYQGWRMAERLEYDTAVYLNILAIGSAHDFKNQLDSSLFYYDKGIRIAEREDNQEQIFNFIFFKGIAHFYQSNYAQSISFFDRALQYWETSGNLEKQSKVLNNIGVIYRLRNEFDKAIKIYLRSIDIKSQLKDTIGQANSYSNLGMAYYHRDEHQESLQAYQNAFELYNHLKKEYEAATVLAGMGNTLVALEKYDEAENSIRKALPELEKKLTLDLIGAYLSLSIIERSKGNPQAALNYIEPYYDVVTQLDRINSRSSFEQEMFACYDALGNYEKALFHLKNYTELYKESSNETKQRLTEEMQARFETREKENTIRLQELEIEKGDREKQALFFGVAFALMAIAGMVVFTFSKIRNNRKLSAEKAKTETLLRDRETLLREIHHRVKNNLQVVSSLLSIQGREITDDKAQQAVTESRNRVHSMALIHQFLYGEQNVSSIDMPEYVGQLSRKLFSTYRVDHDQVQLHVDVDPVLLDVDTAIPVGLIINELITNALKYAFPQDREGNLWVSLKEKNKVLTLQVRDDGVGAKNAIPKSTSFGMKLLNAFKQKLEAEFEIANDSGMQIEYAIRKYKTA